MPVLLVGSLAPRTLWQLLRAGVPDDLGGRPHARSRRQRVTLPFLPSKGTMEGFSYSKANKEKAVHWDEETLFDYLLVRRRHRLELPCILQNLRQLTPPGR